MRRYLTLRQVAERLGKTPSWMHRHIRRLVREHRFPPRDAAMGGWDEGAIRAWQDARLTPAQPVTIQIALPDDVDIGAELDRRAAALFAGEAA